MNIAPLAAAAGANAALILSILGGSAYIAACEARATSSGHCDSQWLAGLAMMGIGGAGRAGFGAGFNTYNPELRSPGEAPRQAPPAKPRATKRRRVEEVVQDAVIDAAADRLGPLFRDAFRGR